MIGVPLWAWILAAIGLVILFMRLTLRSYRREVRAQFLAWIEAHHPDWSTRPLDPYRIAVTIPEVGEVTVGLDRLYSTIAATRDRSAAARAHHYQAFARPLADQVITAADAARLRPRLVTPEWLAAVPAGQEVVHRPLHGTDLSIAYVLDSPQTVTFVTERQRDQLGLDAAAIHQRALANLRPSLAAEVVRRVLGDKRREVLRSGDSFDAARLLLVPPLLAEGETVFALIPDRDTLILAAEADGLRERPTGPPLLSHPLRVTRAGVEPV